jgi:hypothetical protein
MTAAEAKEKFHREMRKVQDAIQTFQDAQNRERPYTAVLIEPRPAHPATEFVLQNLLENLDETWGILVFHGPSAQRPAQPALQTLRISYRSLPTDTFTSPTEYSQYVASEEFLEQIPTEVFLIVRTDSMINPSQKHRLAEFLQYDYVGAPWPWKEIPYGGNGGISLRRKTPLLKALRAFGGLKGPYEDQFFSRALAAIGAHMPPKERAKEFAVEQMFHPAPFAFHRPWDHLPTRFADLVETCPGLQTLADFHRSK